MKRYKVIWCDGTAFTMAVSKARAINNVKFRLRKQGIYTAFIEFTAKEEP